MDANKEKNPNVLLNKYADKMSETVLNFIESNDIMGRKFTIDRKNDDFFLEYGLANFIINGAINRIKSIIGESNPKITATTMATTLYAYL